MLFRSYVLDEERKVLNIISIPKEEIKIYPDFEYYDTTADFLNPFDAKDYNAIKTKVNGLLMKKIEASNLKSNAQTTRVASRSSFR